MRGWAMRGAHARSAWRLAIQELKNVDFYMITKTTPCRRAVIGICNFTA